MSDLAIQVRLKADGSGLVGEVRLSREEIDRLTSATRLAGSEARRAAAEQSAWANRVAAAGRAASAAGGVYRRLRSEVLSLRSAFLALGAATALRSIVTTAANFQQLEARLRTVTGSADAAGRVFRELTAFASKTPNQLNEVVEAFIRLRAVGLAPTERDLLAFADIASGMGANIQQFSEAVVGALVGETERLKAFGITARIEGDRLAVSFGGVTTIVRRDGPSLLAFFRELGETKFGGSAAREMVTLRGAFSNFGDEAAKAANAIGDAGLSAAVIELTGRLRDFIATNKDAQAAIGEGLGNAVRFAADSFAWLARNMDLVAAALAALATSRVVGAVVTIAGAVATIHPAARLATLALTAAAGGLAAYVASQRDAQEVTSLSEHALESYTEAVSALGAGATAVDTLGEKFKALARDLDPAIEAKEKFEEASDLLVMAVEREIVTVERARELLELARQKYEHLTAAEKAQKVVIDQLAASYRALAVGLAEIEGRQREGRDLLRTQLDQLRDEVALARLSERDREVELKTRELLNAAREHGLSLGEEEIALIRAKVAQHVDELAAIAAARRAQERAIAEWRKLWENAATRIQDSLAGAFRRGLDGGVNSFRDFGREIVNLMKDVAAQIAALLVFRPVVGGVLNALGLGGLSGGIGGSGGGAFDLLSGGKNALDLFGVESPFSGFGTKVTDFLGLTNSAALTAGLPAVALTSGMAPTLAGIYGAEGLAAGAAGLGGGAGFLSAALPIAGLALGAAGLFGAFGSKPKTVIGHTNLFYDPASGSFVTGTSGASGGFSPGETSGAVGQAAAILNALLAQGATLRPDAAATFSQQLQYQNYGTFLTGAIAGGQYGTKVLPVTPGYLNTPFDGGATVGSAQEAVVALVRNVAETVLDFPTQAIRDAFGQGGAEKVAEVNAAAAKLVEDLRLQILRIVDPQGAALAELDRATADRKATLEAAGLTTELVDQLAALERAKIMEQFAGSVDQAAVALRQMASDLRQSADGLLLDPALSPLAAPERLAQARGLFAASASAAIANRDLEAARQAQALAQDVIRASREVFATSAPFVQDFNQTRATLLRIADTFDGGVAGFAVGGRPRVGDVVQVGEAGREYFVADRPGQIVPASRMSAPISASAGGDATAPLLGALIDEVRALRVSHDETRRSLVELAAMTADGSWRAGRRSA